MDTLTTFKNQDRQGGDTSANNIFYIGMHNKKNNLFNLFVTNIFIKYIY